MQLINYALKKNDEDKLQCTEYIKAEINQYVDDFGEEIIINPFVINDWKDNPFKAETRKFPVDLMMPFVETSTVVLSIPDGYSIKSYPQAIRFALPDNKGSFTYSSVKNGDRILQIQVKVQFNHTVFDESQYLMLKNLYSMISEKMSESVQLTKNL